MERRYFGVEKNLYNQVKKYEDRLKCLKKCPAIERLWSGSNKEYYITQLENDACVLNLLSSEGIYRFMVRPNVVNNIMYGQVFYCETPIGDRQYFAHSRETLLDICEAMKEVAKVFKIEVYIPKNRNKFSNKVK